MLALPRLLHRLRDQGAAGAAAHLAARRRCRGAGRARGRCWSACSTRSARSASCATACRCSRRPRASSRRWCSSLAVIGIIYGALLAVGQSDMKRFVSYTSIAHFGFIALGIFAFTTAVDRRRGALHGQPRHRDRPAVPRRRHAHRPRRLAADRRLRRRRGKVAPVLGGVLPDRRAGLAGAARHELVRQRVPGADRHVHPREPVCTVIATIGIVLAAALHAAGSSSARCTAAGARRRRCSTALGRTTATPAAARRSGRSAPGATDATTGDRRRPPAHGTAAPVRRSAT